jgi:hypothetical protein
VGLAVGAAALAITLVACGTNNDARQRTDSHATPVAIIDQQNKSTSRHSDTVRQPDLTNSAIRKRFVCSFADGYFTEPEAPRDNPTPHYCSG